MGMCTGLKEGRENGMSRPNPNKGAHPTQNRDILYKKPIKEMQKSMKMKKRNSGAMLIAMCLDKNQTLLLQNTGLN